MSEWNKSVVAQPGAGMSVLSNTLTGAPGAKPVVFDVGPSSRSFLSAKERGFGEFVTAPPRSGMSVAVNQEMLDQAVSFGTKQGEADAFPLSALNVIRDSITAAFSTLGNILIEEVVLSFHTRSGKDLLINPFDQASIDAAKAAAPGEGVGPAVSSHLVALMGRGLIADASILPAEYRHLSALIGTSPSQAEAMAANCNTKIQFDKEN